MKALSIRQPWAWLILNAGKDVENRGSRWVYRGPVLIHVGASLTKDEYRAWRTAGESMRSDPEPRAKVPEYSELKRGGFVGIVQVLADLAAAGGAIALEQGFELGDQIGVRAEMAEVGIAFGFLDLQLGAHALAVVAMEGIALGNRRLDLFATEDVLERLHHRRGAGAGAAGNGDDRMLH